MLSLGVGIKGGDSHSAHADWYDTKGDLSNVLVVTMLLYMTTPEEGGSTFFPEFQNGPGKEKGYHFKAKRGDLAIW